MTAEGPLRAGAGGGAADAGQLPGVAEEQQTRTAPSGHPHLVKSFEVLRAELQGFVHDHEVVHGQECQSFLQRPMEKKSAVTSVHIDSRVALAHASRKLPGGQSVENARLLALRSPKADVCNGGLAAAGRSRADQDVVRIGSLLRQLDRVFWILGIASSERPVDAVVDLLLEQALVDIQGNLLRVSVQGRSRRHVHRRHSVALVQGALHVLLNEAALGRKHSEGIVDVAIAVSCQLESCCHLGVIGPIAGGLLQGGGMKHEVRGHSFHNFDIQKLAHVAERQVKGHPLAEELVVQDPNGLGRDHLLPTGLAAPGELEQRLIGTTFSVRLLDPGEDLPVGVGLPQPLEQAHVIAAPGAGLVQLHELRLLRRSGPGGLQRPNGAAHEELQEELRGQQQPHLRLAGLVGGENANRHAVAGASGVIQ